MVDYKSLADYARLS